MADRTRAQAGPGERVLWNPRGCDLDRSRVEFYRTESYQGAVLERGDQRRRGSSYHDHNDADDQQQKHYRGTKTTHPSEGCRMDSHRRHVRGRNQHDRNALIARYAGAGKVTVIERRHSIEDDRLSDPKNVASYTPGRTWLRLWRCR